MKKISFIAMACSLGVTLQAQIIIDPLNGTAGDLGNFTTYLVNDRSLGAGDGVSFSDSSGSLAETYVGATSNPEQALFLAPASAFSTTFAVGDTLSVVSTVGTSSTAEDFGLAIGANNPTAATASTATGGDASWDSRGYFDWASISVRPNASGGNIRQNTSISGTVTTGSFNLNPGFPVEGLYITWVAPLEFTLGYINGSGVEVADDTVTFNSGSTIGDEIGFYGDLRATSTSIGSFSDLTIAQVPEPSILALSGMGMASFFMLRRKK